jgi:hypothetical protein
MAGTVPSLKMNLRDDVMNGGGRSSLLHLLPLIEGSRRIFERLCCSLRWSAIARAMHAKCLSSLLAEKERAGGRFQGRHCTRNRTT